jgi:hypothetical protein
MSSKTTVVDEQCHLQERATQIRNCQSCPAGMSVVSWCTCHGIIKANYYYRLSCVRKVCLEAIQKKMPAQQMVPVQPELLQHQKQNGRNPSSGLDISIKGFSVHVTESTSMSLLAEILKVVQHAE